MRVKIDWDWKYLPSNSDVCTPLANVPLGEYVALVFINHTQGDQVVIECDGDYGLITKEEV